MRYIFDIQHQGKAQDTRDRGAHFEGIDEVQHTQRYVGVAASMLDNAIVIGHGGARGYPVRWGYVKALMARDPQPTCYIACHVNAGGADYGIVAHDPRSGYGTKWAKALVESPVGTAYQLRQMAVKKTDWTRRMRNTFHGIYAVRGHCFGVCLEPYFIEYKDLDWAQEFGERLGQALQSL